MEIVNLKKKLGLKISNPQLFTEAFTHKSYVNENRHSKRNHNERLEFLGDAVLELVTTEFLFHHFPHKEEGELTAFRSALVRGEHLAEVAIELDLGDYLFVSHGEEKSGGREKHYILANTFEALIGAIYLDEGYKKVRKVLDQVLLPRIETILSEQLYKDAKSLFQEIAQEKRSTTPHFELITEEGPDHNKVFVMGAYLKEELVGKGEGSSKQKAETEAAKEALENLNWL
jgi:ribonuclease-3